MKKNIFIISILIFFNIGFMQNADLVTQKIKLENAMRDKINTTVSKFLDPSQYIIVVNARLDFKPVSFDPSNRSKSNQNYESSSYTFIPGLDMPSIPTDQTIYKPTTNTGLSGYKYSSSLLYGLEIIVYLDEAIATGSMQQNLRSLIQNNIPEVIDCIDCIKFETLDILTQGSRPNTINDRIAQLEEERINAEKELQNWRFSQLEEQLAIAQDARKGWEDQAKNREEQRRLADSARMANLEKIEKVYRDKQDSLYILTSIKLDEAIRGRIESEENTKQELLDLIKLQIQGENIDESNLSSNTQAGLYGRKPMSPSSTIDGKTWIIILLVILIITAILFVILKNRQPIYLKPKAPTNSSNKNEKNEEKFMAPSTTEAHSNDDVVRSELQSLRQQAVSMSVSEKSGSNQIVKDWLDDKVDGEEDEANTTNEE